MSSTGSNIFLDRIIRPASFSRWLWGVMSVVCLAGTAQALDANRRVSEYIRDRWEARQGFMGGSVYAIAQTPDGYLWLGSEKGLVRFDGLDFLLFDHTNSPDLPPGPVLELLTDSEGNLWIRPQGWNMLCYRDGVFHNVMPQLDSARNGVTAICRGTKGEVLFQILGSGTVAYRGGGFEKLSSPAEMSKLLVISMAQTADGRIWMGTRDTGLFSLNQGQMSAFTKALPDRKINSLLAIGGRELWIGTDNGVLRWKGDDPSGGGMTSLLNHVQALAMATDHDSNIWIGTPRGLLRLSAGGITSAVEGDGAPAEAVNAIFEDREGNLWVGRRGSLERLRDSPFMTYSVTGNSSSSVTGSSLSEANGPVFIDEGGRTWFAPVAGGLYWLKDGKTGQVRNGGLDADIIYSITGGKGELWIGRQQGGLTRLKYDGGSITAGTYTRSEGLAQNSIYAVHESRDRTVWAGSVSGGVTRIKDGKLTTYTTANGLASNTVTSILETSDGTMWFGTARGLSSLSEDKWRVYGSLDGFPPGTVNCLLEDSTGAIWIGTDNGVAVLRFGQIEIPGELPEPLRERVLGIAEDHSGALWFSTANHILRVHRDQLLGVAGAQADVQEFGLADGLLTVEGVKRHRSVVTDPLGRIWVSTGRGLSVVDPSRAAAKSVPSLVHIEKISADGVAVDAREAGKVSGAHRRITFTYAGVSLSVPERVRFRYMLEGFDPGWSEPSASREAVYTNLNPGSYVFRVTATNSYGLWNSAEAVIRLEIQPGLWQTWWFQVGCVAAVALATVGLYRLRMRRLRQQLNARFEERLGERTRIAQELHDTLLQGFLSASIQLHVAADQLPGDSPARPQLDRVLRLIGRVIEEGRNAVRGLRSSRGGGPADLEQAFSTIPQQLSIQDQTGFRVIVEGRSRPLHPLIRDEVYRIGREALVNAFRHSRAKNIEVGVEYAPSHLRVLVRDDGCGIDPQVLQSGREGHWGLPGMRERAEAIGARLKVWSAATAGTEVELSVPSHVAFESERSNSWRNWLARKWRPTDEQE